MADENDDVRWGLKKRLEFIEWRAFWDGRVNRRDLEERFQISTPQASADFARYQTLVAGNNVTYDSTEKTYVTGDDFRPRFLPMNSERYLRQLEALHAGAIEKNDTWFDNIPPMDGVPLLTRAPEAFVLRAILEAIRDRKAIEVYYQSFREASNRIICPHALAYDGHRWHVRALSTEHGEFRDYVLGRIWSVTQPTRPGNSDPLDDVEWEEKATLRLTAHPDLNENQRKAVEHDFRMKEDGVLEVPMRLALTYYFIRRNNLDLRSGQIEPQRAQVFLQNYDEVNAACKRAQTESRERIARRRAAAGTS